MRLRKCSVEELAGICFLTPSAISGYRSGLRSPNIEILRILAKNLDVSSDFLIGLQEEIYV
jgi:transcriptional regulator with XRE-family HTH domain